MFTNSANFQIPSSKTMISAAASAAATAVLLRSITRGLIPRDLQHYFYFKLRAFFSSFSSQFTIVIQEFDGLSNNELFNAALLYLETINPIQAQRKLRVAMLTKETKISVSVDRNEEIEDDFDGVRVKWKLVSTKIPSRNRKEKCCFELTFHRKYKDWILNNYLPYVLEKSKQVQEERKTIKLFTLESYRRRRRGKLWQSVNLNHPATFGTLAMEADVKRRVMEDLERFVERKEFYRKVGKAWKRGYLLFGPPGTGKSSLIAAMANYLNFDVYDLELTEIRSNLELRRLLVSVASRSILVVEDIDCSISWKNRIAPDKSTNSRRYGQGTEVTLSGLLNFIDGLWPSCGDERIIIFTTNHKDRFDPALLRPGRMDVHIHMSYCTPCGFKLLTSNYLGTPDNSLVMEVEELLETVKVTPAEVGEQLMKDNNPRTVLRGLIEFLEHKLRVQNHGDTTEAEMGISKKEDNQDLKENQYQSCTDSRKEFLMKISGTD